MAPEAVRVARAMPGVLSSLVAMSQLAAERPGQLLGDHAVHITGHAAEAHLYGQVGERAPDRGGAPRSGASAHALRRPKAAVPMTFARPGALRTAVGGPAQAADPRYPANPRYRHPGVPASGGVPGRPGGAGGATVSVPAAVMGRPVSHRKPSGRLDAANIDAAQRSDARIARLSYAAGTLIRATQILALLARISRSGITRQRLRSGPVVGGRDGRTSKDHHNRRTGRDRADTAADRYRPQVVHRLMVTTRAGSQAG
jgi:hypothetical protein